MGITVLYSKYSKWCPKSGRNNTFFGGNWKITKKLETITNTLFYMALRVFKLSGVESWSQIYHYFFDGLL